MDEVMQELRDNGLAHFVDWPVNKLDETIKWLAYDKSSNARKNTYLLTKLIKVKLNPLNSPKT